MIKKFLLVLEVNAEKIIQRKRSQSLSILMELGKHVCSKHMTNELSSIHWIFACAGNNTRCSFSYAFWWGFLWFFNCFFLYIRIGISVAEDLIVQEQRNHPNTCETLWTQPNYFQFQFIYSNFFYSPTQIIYTFYDNDN